MTTPSLREEIKKIMMGAFLYTIDNDVQAILKAISDRLPKHEPGHSYWDAGFHACLSEIREMLK